MNSKPQSISNLLFNSPTQLVVTTITDSGKKFLSADVSPDSATPFSPLDESKLKGQVRSTVSSTGRVTILALPVEKPVGTIQVPKEDYDRDHPVKVLATSLTSQRVITQGLEHYKMKLWDIAKGKLVSTLVHDPGESRIVSYAKFSPDGQTLVSTSPDGRVWLWRAKDGTKTRSWKVGEGSLGTLELVFSPDSKILAITQPYTQFISLWNVQRGEMIENLGIKSGQHDYLEMSTFSPDGKVLVATGRIGEDIYAWDVEQTRLLGSFSRSISWLSPGEHRAIGNVAFSPDGKLLAEETAPTGVGASEPALITVWGVR